MTTLDRRQFLKTSAAAAAVAACPGILAAIGYPSYQEQMRKVFGTGSTFGNFEHLTRAYGGHYHKVQSVEAIDGAVKEALTADRLSLIELEAKEMV